MNQTNLLIAIVKFTQILNQLLEGIESEQKWAETGRDPTFQEGNFAG